MAKIPLCAKKNLTIDYGLSGSAPHRTNGSRAFNFTPSTDFNDCLDRMREESDRYHNWLIMFHDSVNGPLVPVRSSATSDETATAIQTAKAEMVAVKPILSVPNVKISLAGPSAHNILGHQPIAPSPTRRPGEVVKILGDETRQGSPGEFVAHLDEAKLVPAARSVTNIQGQKVTSISEIEVTAVGSSQLIIDDQTVLVPTPTSNGELLAIPQATVALSGSRRLVVEGSEASNGPAGRGSQVIEPPSSRPDVVATISNHQISVDGGSFLVIDKSQAIAIPPSTVGPGALITVSGIQISRLGSSKIVLDRTKTVDMPQTTPFVVQMAETPGLGATVATVSNLQMEMDGPSALVIDHSETIKLPPFTTGSGALETVSGIQISRLGLSQVVIDGSETVNLPTAPQATQFPLADLDLESSTKPTDVLDTTQSQLAPTGSTSNPGSGPMNNQTTGLIPSEQSGGGKPLGTLLTSVKGAWGNTPNSTAFAAIPTATVSALAPWHGSAATRCRESLPWIVCSMVLEAFAVWLLNYRLT